MYVPDEYYTMNVFYLRNKAFNIDKTLVTQVLKQVFMYICMYIKLYYL